MEWWRWVICGVAAVAFVVFCCLLRRSDRRRSMDAWSRSLWEADQREKRERQRERNRSGEA